MSINLIVCVIHAALAGLCTTFAFSAAPSLAGAAVYSGLLSLAYGVRWATQPRPDPSPFDEAPA